MLGNIRDGRSVNNKLRHKSKKQNIAKVDNTHTHTYKYLITPNLEHTTMKEKYKHSEGKSGTPVTMNAEKETYDEEKAENVRKTVEKEMLESRRNRESNRERILLGNKFASVKVSISGGLYRQKIGEREDMCHHLIRPEPR